MNTVQKIRVYAVTSILAMTSLLGAIILANTLPAHELPPVYIMGMVINPSLAQLLIAIIGCLSSMALIRHVVTATRDHSVLNRLAFILGTLVFSALMALLCMRALLTYTTFSEMPSTDYSTCALIYSERVTIMDHHSGILYVANKSAGIAADTGYRWAGGHDSLPDIAKLKWESGVGSIEPWDIVEPTPDRPAQITCP